MTVTLDRNVEAFIGAPRQLFIDGQWTAAASGKTFDTPNPATGETLARVAEGDAEDINRAVAAARQAFEDGPWSRMTPAERGRIVFDDAEDGAIEGAANAIFFNHGQCCVAGSRLF